MKKCLVLLCAIISCTSYAQLTVNGGLTAQQLAENLAGPNVTVFNAQITGGSPQSGTFNFTGNNFEIPSGIILTSGFIHDAVGPNNSSAMSGSNFGPGSSLLSELSGQPTYDAITLEFEFEVQSTSILFNYIFASEEYNEWVGSPFNDAFGFFISGPGITGEENLAVVPTTRDAITINNINNYSYWQFYRDNTDANTNIQFDGFTTLMTAKKDGLIPCQVYKLKLIIADGSDDIYDAAVFLKENSLVQELVSAVTNTVNADGIALEGCYDARFTFSLDKPQPTDTKINYTIAGTAINGVDYRKIDTSITIPAGQTSATIVIDAYGDGIPEPQEYAELSFYPKPCAPLQTVKLFIDDNQPIDFSLSSTDLTCNGDATGQINASITGGFGPYKVTLNDADVYATLPITGLAAGTYQVKVDDKYGCRGDAQVVGAEFDAGTTFLPDGNGNVYTSSVEISGFNPSATLVSAGQLQSVCLELEHSFMGDVEMKLIAPEGKAVTLKERPGGNNVNFGEPVATGPVDTKSEDTTPGNGYAYCFSADPVYLTMVEESKNNYTYDYVDNAGNNHHNEKYLPSGAYQPYQSFEELIGAPLNGTWTIWVKDHKPNDNGYIFKWSISFSSDRPADIVIINEPSPVQITGGIAKAACASADGAVDIAVQGLHTPFSYLWSTGAATQDISGVPAGAYTVTVTDASACSTQKTFLVSNSNAPSISGEVTNVSCNGMTDGQVSLSVQEGTDYSYSWSNGKTTKDIDQLTSGTYFVTVTDNATGCISLQSFLVTQPTTLVASGVISNEKCGDREGIVSLSVSGGTAPYVSVWNNGATTQSIDDLQAGEYTVTVSDSHGCHLTKSFEVLNEVGDCIPDCNLAITPISIVDESCGQSNGSIDLAISTIYGPYWATWSNGIVATNNLNNLSAGTYTINVRDFAGCEASQSFVIDNETGSLAFGTVVITDDQCGKASGSIDVVVTGGAAPYNFLWSNGFTGEDLRDVGAGSYMLTVTDQSGCSLAQSYALENDAGTLSQYFGYAVDEVCGNGQGSIDITFKDGAQPYSYAWTNGSTNEDLRNIAAGTYSCMVTDATGCSLSTPVYVISNTPGSLDVEFVDIDHENCGSGDGSIELYITGGGPPYNYTWSNGQSGMPLIQNLSQGLYTCTVTDQAGCAVESGAILILDDPGTLQIDNIFTRDENCGDHTGAIDIEVSEALSSLSFLWSNGAATEDIGNLAAGTYSVSVSDADGCAVNAVVSVMNNAGSLALNNVTILPDLCGAGSGSVALSLSGGTLPFTYAWSNGASSADLQGVSAGKYTYIVADANGCQLSGEAVVGGSGIIVQAIQLTNESCGMQNGSIELQVSGGTGPYSYLWSTGVSSAKLSDVSAGTYSCAITDALGCSINTNAIPVGGNSGDLTVATSVSFTDCGTGVINLVPSGGEAPFNYAWSNGETTQELNVAEPGIYSCYVTDASGLCRSITYDASSFPQSPVSAFAYQADCSTLYVATFGGSFPYSFLWSTGEDTQFINISSPGIYTCKVLDANGCPAYSTVNVPSIKILSVTTDITYDCNTNTGNIDVTLTSGSGPISYTWFDSNFTIIGFSEDLSGVPPGLYYLSYGNSSCWDFLAVFVESVSVNVYAIVTDDCGGLGSIEILVSGGAEPYTYAWSNGETTKNIYGLSPGQYDVLITDAYGCSTYYSAAVSETGIAHIEAIPYDDICERGTGRVQLLISGAADDYEFVWSNGESTQDIYNLFAGEYSCSVTHVPSGCTRNITATVAAVLNDLNIIADDLQPDACLSASGLISVTVTGGYPDYQYYWASGQTTEDISNLTEGLYALTVYDGLGCSITESFLVGSVSSGVVVQDLVVTADHCVDGSGRIDITLSGGSGEYLFLWSNGDITEDLSNVDPGEYNCIITDAGDGCQVEVSAKVAAGQGSVAIQTEAIQPDVCEGSNGAIYLTVSGGNGNNYGFVWSNGAVSDGLLDVPAGTYTLVVTDEAGCESQASFTVEGSTLNFGIEDIHTTDEACGNGNGSLQVTAGGGSGQFTYEWESGQTTADLVDLSEGWYHVQVTDAVYGCFAEESVYISNLATITISADDIVDAACGDSGGEIRTSITGANGPFSFNWSDGSTDQDLVDAGAGTYTLTVTDAGNCSATETFTIDPPAVEFRISNTLSTPDACNDGNGAVDITMQGGSGSYFYFWSNGANSEDLLHVPAGDYTVMVYDLVYGCTYTAPAQVAAGSLAPIGHTLDVVNEQCANKRGAVTLEVSGGSGSFSFAWSHGINERNIDHLSAGNYMCVITDQVSGCKKNAFATVGNDNIAVIPFVLTRENDVCNNGLGSIQIGVACGTAPYSFVWSNGFNAQNVTGIKAGTYGVTVTDAAGCAGQASFIVENEIPFSIPEADITPAACADCKNGAIKLHEPATGNFEFTWFNGTRGNNILGLAPGKYAVTVIYTEDNLSCSATQEYQVGIDASLDRTVVMYPNPTEDEVFFNNESGEYLSTIVVIDKLGRVVFRGNATQVPGEFRFKADLSTISNGSYILKVLKGSDWITYRLIKF